MRTKEQMKAYRKAWYEKNRDRQRAKMKAYYRLNITKIQEYNRKNKKRILQNQKLYRLKNSSELNAKTRIWKANNKLSVKATQKKWMQDNKVYMRRYRKQRYASDIQVNLAKRLREKIRHALKQWGRKNHTSKADYLMGCTPKEFLQHMKKKFKKGMTLKNVHIDHIQPVCSFDLRSLEQQKKCFHYTNCQPLFPHENIKKRNTEDCRFFKKRRQYKLQAIKNV